VPKRANRVGRPRKDTTGLRKETVLEEALKILDAGGEPALTFRALAKELGVTAMAVSHHVGSRKEMLASLVATVYADVAKEPSDASPKERLRYVLRNYCERVIAHPHLAHCVLSDPSLMSDEISALTAKARETLAALGADSSDLETRVNVVIDYTHGFALSAAAPQTPEDRSTAARPSIAEYVRGLDWLLGKV
jgi:AcrR family transcriptional regulator